MAETTLPAKKVNGTLFKFDPLEMFDTVQEEMDRFWRRPFAALPSVFTRPAGQLTSWAPRLDVFEKDNTLIVKAELPGVKKEDVQVELDAGMLVIKGETRSETEAKEQTFYRMERTFGSYYRRVPLPFEVTPEQVHATMQDGVLEIQIPKPAAASPAATKIAVS
jgi:HSP20 family protein